MRLAELAAASGEVGATAARSAKTARLAQALRAAGPDEVGLAALYLSGELRQRRTGTGHRSLAALPPPAEAPSLELREVDDAFAALAEVQGAGSAARRRALLSDLFGRATEPEQRLLARQVSTDGWTVVVRPELVVEVAVDGVQTSPRYPAGMALRFARVVRYRPDKTAVQADTVDDVRRLHLGQAGSPGP